MSNAELVVLFAFGAWASLSTLAAWFYRTQYLHYEEQDMKEYWCIGEVERTTRWRVTVASCEGTMQCVPEGTPVYVTMESIKPVA